MIFQQKMIWNVSSYVWLSILNLSCICICNQKIDHVHSCSSQCNLKDSPCIMIPTVILGSWIRDGRSLVPKNGLRYIIFFVKFLPISYILLLSLCYMLHAVIKWDELFSNRHILSAVVSFLVHSLSSVSLLY